MRLFFLILFFLFLSTFNYSQKYQPFDTNIVWKVYQTGVASYSGTSDCYRTDAYHYFVKGYLLNNGRLWHKVYANIFQGNYRKMSTSGFPPCNSTFMPTNSTQFMGMFSNDTLNKKVHFVTTATLASNFTPTDNNIIFNFNKVLGDTMSVYRDGNPTVPVMNYKIITIDSVLLGAKYYKVLTGIKSFTPGFYPNYAHFIEGIGCDGGVFNSDFYMFQYRSSKLGCFSNTNYTKYYYGINTESVYPQTYPTALRDTTVCFYGLPAGIIVNSLQANVIKMYPNPTNALLTVEIENGTKLNIVNVLGQLVKEEDINTVDKNKNIDIRNLQNGIYFLQVFDNEKLIGTAKIVKE